VKDVTSAAKDLKKITSDISEITGSEKENIKVAIENIKSITERLDKIVKDVETGEGSVGKLLSDKEMGENLKKTVESIKGTSDEAKKALGRLTLFRTYWEYELRHSGKYDEYKSDVGLKIRPRTGKYYYLGVSNAATANTKTNESKNTFNLNIGQSFNIDSVQFGTVYAGMIRSAGGAGIKVKPLWKWNPWNKLEITAEAYDFGRETVEKKVKPKINTGIRISPTKWFNVGGTIEDIAEEADLHTTANISFEDEDIAYLLGLIGLARP